MPRADFPGVLGVIVEILGGEHAVFVTDQAVSSHVRGIELDLNLYVFGNGVERAGEFLHEHLLGFAFVVDVTVVPVAFVGEFFELGIFVVAHAEAEDRKEHAAVLGFVLNQRDKFIIPADADVEIPVGAENHAVRAARDQIVRWLAYRPDECPPRHWWIRPR